jgi:chitodextrinase
MSANKKLLTAVGLFFCFAPLCASAQSNQASPLGTNLWGIGYASPEQPFLNIFKTGGQWGGTTTTGARYAQAQGVFDLDTNGYPKSMTGLGIAAGQTFSEIDAAFLMAQTPPFYRAGNYVLLWDGAASASTFNFVNDCTNSNIVSSAAGRIVINIVTPSYNGCRIQLRNLNGVNYPTNIRFVYSPDSNGSIIGANETQLKNGEVFNPDFISRTSRFKTLRFMDWMATNTSRITNWGDMTTPTYVWWSIVPVEVQVALCNKVGADGWFNMPPLSTDAFVSQFATVVHNGSTDSSGRTWSGLNSNLKAYVEYGNEIWNNGALATFNNLISLGWAAFPNAQSDWNAAFIYGILRAVQNGATWKSVWSGDATRVIRVLAGQCAWSGRNQYIMGFTAGMFGGDPSRFAGTAAANAEAFAVAPYFGYPVPNTFTLDQLFTEMMSGGLAPNGYPGGMVKQAVDWMAQNYADAKSFGLPLVAYEGGQTFVDYSHSDTTLQSLYTAANRDPRMGAAYTAYLNGWKNAGGTLFINFSDITPFDQWGFWGALENVLQTSSAKYDALMNFISNNPCWWNACSTTSGTSTPTPSADTTPQTVPAGVTGVAVSTTQVNLSWTASTDNVGVTGYNVYRNGTKIGTTSNTSYQDTGLSAGTTYLYTVSAYDSAGNSSAQASNVSVSTLATTSVSAPSVTINSPTNGATPNGSVNIAVAASSTIGIASITITADGNPLATCFNVSSCATTWQKKKISRGAHSIGGVATDTHGKSSNASVSVTIMR